MRLLYLSNSTLPGEEANGVHVMRMCEALAPRVEGLRLVARMPRGGDPGGAGLASHYGLDREIDCVRYRRRRWSDRMVMWRQRWWRPDVMCGRSPELLRYNRRCPFVLELHMLPSCKGPEAGRLLRTLLGSPLLLGAVVISEALKEALVGETGLDRSRVWVLPDGAKPAGRAGTRVLDRRRGGDLIAGYAGSLLPGKGMEVIAEIAGLGANATFHVVGGQPEEVERWRRDPRCAGVVFHGRVPPGEVAAYIAAFDVCLLPNQREVLTRGGEDIGRFTSPLKLFEYMAAGKAILASDLPVMREVINEEVAMMVSPDDPDGWAEGLKRLADARLRGELGQAALRLFERGYSWEARADTLLRIIREGLEERFSEGAAEARGR